MTTIDRISHMLKLQNKTQRSLADHLGIHKSTISLWQNGSCHSYNRYLPEIADFFDITIDELVRDKSPQKTNEYMPVIVKAKNHGVTADELSIALNFAIAIKERGEK